MRIVDGLSNATIEIAAQLRDYFNTSEAAGGDLGGTIATFDAVLQLAMEGTGDLEGYARNIPVGVSGEIHFGPRDSGEFSQGFPLIVMELAGTVIGDPDFDQIEVEAGETYGLSGPGYTELNRLGEPGAPFDVGSFFSLEYTVSFEGAPGSVLEGLSGATTDTGVFELCPSTSGVPPDPTDPPGPSDPPDLPDPSDPEPRDSWGRIKVRASEHR